MDSDKVDVLRRSYDNANNCGDHPDCVPWKLDDVASVVHAWELEVGDCAESQSACVVLLKSGNYGTVTEWGDTTGHG